MAPTALEMLEALPLIRFVVYHRVDSEKRRLIRQEVAYHEEAVQHFVLTSVPYYRAKVVATFVENVSRKKSFWRELDKALAACRNRQADLLVPRLDPDRAELVAVIERAGVKFAEPHYDRRPAPGWFTY